MNECKIMFDPSILGPLVGLTEYHVKNSKDLADFLASVMVEEDERFA